MVGWTTTQQWIHSENGETTRWLVGELIRKLRRYWRTSSSSRSRLSSGSRRSSWSSRSSRSRRTVGTPLPPQSSEDTQNLADRAGSRRAGHAGSTADANRSCSRSADLYWSGPRGGVEHSANVGLRRHKMPENLFSTPWLPTRAAEPIPQGSGRPARSKLGDRTGWLWKLAQNFARTGFQHPGSDVLWTATDSNFARTGF